MEICLGAAAVALGRMREASAVPWSQHLGELQRSAVLSAQLPMINRETEMDELLKLARDALEEAQAMLRHTQDRLIDYPEFETCRISISGISRNITATLTALAQPQLRDAPEGWKTIESAPKDGTRVLLRVPGPFRDPTETGVAVGCWTGNSDNWWLTCVWASSTADQAPTHWMPILPAPPSPDAIRQTEESQ